MTRVLVLNGPNLGRLGSREPDVYGDQDLSTLRHLLGELAADGTEIDAGLVVAIALTAVYPLVLGLVGFYLPQERQRIGAFGRRFMLGRV